MDVIYLWLICLDTGVIVVDVEGEFDIIRLDILFVNLLHRLFVRLDTSIVDFNFFCLRLDVKHFCFGI